MKARIGIKWREQIVDDAENGNFYLRLSPSISYKIIRTEEEKKQMIQEIVDEIRKETKRKRK